MLIQVIIALLALPGIALLGYLLLKRYTTYQLRHTTHKSEFKESVAEGAIEEPHPARDLSEQERQFIADNTQGMQTFMSSPLKWLTLFIITTLLIGFLSFALLDEANISISKDIGTIRFLLSVGIVSFLLDGAFLLRTQHWEMQFYKDQNLPVWQVQGGFVPLEKKVDHKNRFRTIRFSVRDVPFHLESTQTPDSNMEQKRNEMVDLLYSISEGEELLVEYSPFSHHVWNITRIDDI